MLEINKFSKNIFTPINLNFSIVDLLLSIKMGIKFKYVINYIPFSSILIILFFNLNNSNHNNIYPVPYLIFLSLIFIVILTIIDSINNKTVLEEIKGNFNYSFTQSYKFVNQNLYSILLPNVLIISLLLLFITLNFFLISFAKTIYGGTLFFSLSYILIFIFGLVSIYIFTSLFISLHFSSIIFTFNGGDAFTTITECFSLTWSKLIKIFIYSIFNIMLTLIFTIFISTIFFINYIFIKFLCGQYFINFWHNLELFLFNTDSFRNPEDIFNLISNYTIIFVILILLSYIISIFLSIFNINKILTYINVKGKKPIQNIFTYNI